MMWADKVPALLKALFEDKTFMSWHLRILRWLSRTGLRMSVLNLLAGVVAFCGSNLLQARLQISTAWSLVLIPLLWIVFFGSPILVSIRMLVHFRAAAVDVVDGLNNIFEDATMPWRKENPKKMSSYLRALAKNIEAGGTVYVQSWNLVYAWAHDIPSELRAKLDGDTAELLQEMAKSSSKFRDCLGTFDGQLVLILPDASSPRYRDFIRKRAKAARISTAALELACEKGLSVAKEIQAERIGRGAECTIVYSPSPFEGRALLTPTTCAKTTYGMLPGIRSEKARIDNTDAENMQALAGLKRNFDAAATVLEALEGRQG